MVVNEGPATAHRQLTARLKVERGRLLGDIRARDDAVRELGKSQHEEGASGAAGDLASDVVEQEVELTLERAERERLAEIDAALDRIASGSYGRCEACGAQIAPGRLEARPWTRYCLACAQREGRLVGRA